MEQRKGRGEEVLMMRPMKLQPRRALVFECGDPVEQDEKGEEEEEEQKEKKELKRKNSPQTLICLI